MDFFGDHILVITLSCYIRVHRAGSQLKIIYTDWCWPYKSKTLMIEGPVVKLLETKNLQEIQRKLGLGLSWWTHPTDLGLLPSWISISRPPAQEFSPSWNARKRVQEELKFQEIPGNSRKSIFSKKTSKKRLKSGKLTKTRPLLL